MILNTIASQGFINPLGVIIYTPSDGMTGYIDNIKINNSADAAYTVSIYRYTRKSNQRILLYTLTLEAGDMINDTQIYQIKSNDHLFATSSSTVSYMISGRETINSG